MPILYNILLNINMYVIINVFLRHFGDLESSKNKT
jgi:hypothetical protein